MTINREYYILNSYLKSSIKDRSSYKVVEAVSEVESAIAPEKSSKIGHQAEKELCLHVSQSDHIHREALSVGLDNWGGAIHHGQKKGA